MESPPPYMPPKKKSNTGLIVGLIIGGVVLCCLLPIGLLVGGGFWIFNKAMPLAGCAIAYQDARSALRGYAAEHEGKLPPAEGWQDAVKKYYDEEVSRHKDMGPITMMPSTGAWGCTHEGAKYGMAYNDDVAGKNLLDAERTQEVVLFEIKSATQNAHMKYEVQPDSEAPPIMFGEKGWFLIRASGDASMSTKGKEVPFRSSGKFGN